MQAMQETQVQSLGWEDHLEEEMTIHSSILAWENADEPVGLQSMESQRVRHNWVTNTFTFRVPTKVGADGLLLFTQCVHGRMRTWSFRICHLVPFSMLQVFVCNFIFKFRMICLNINLKSDTITKKNLWGSCLQADSTVWATREFLHFWYHSPKVAIYKSSRLFFWHYDHVSNTVLVLTAVSCCMSLQVPYWLFAMEEENLTFL